MQSLILKLGNFISGRVKRGLKFIVGVGVLYTVGSIIGAVLKVLIGGTLLFLGATLPLTGVLGLLISALYLVSIFWIFQKLYSHPVFLRMIEYFMPSQRVSAI